MNKSEQKQLNLNLIGPFGAGKGTQSEYLIADFGLEHFVMGEALKAEIKAGSTTGKKIEKIVKAGDLVGDETIKQVLENYLKNIHAERGLIFDGLPRNLDQKIIFDELVEKYQRKPLFIFIDISEQESLRRLKQRKICSECGDKPISMNFSASACHACGGSIVIRYDDRPEIIQHRLGVYREEVVPVINAYLKEGHLYRVDGEQDPLAVHKDIMNVLKKLGFSNNELH